TVRAYGPMYLTTLNRLRVQTLKNIATEYPTASPQRQQILKAQIADNAKPLQFKDLYDDPVAGKLNQQHLRRIMQMKRLMKSGKAMQGNTKPIWYQGVRAGRAGKGTSSGWWTDNLNLAKRYAESEGRGGEIHIRFDEDMRKYSFADPRHEEYTPISPD